MENVSGRLAALWHLESATIVGALTRLLGDLTQAEDIAQDTLLTALEHWQQQGIPHNPGGWLMVTARHKALDQLRQQKRRTAVSTDEADIPGEEFAVETLRDSEVNDDVLRLMFICCHPLLSPDSRVALVLRLVAGLSVEDIARAYLVPVTTLAQRITRAKKTLTAARIPFELPAEKERQARVQSVLEAIYLMFNEGYVATTGHDWAQPGLCQQALRLSRSLAELLGDETEVLGLAALLEFQASRLEARQDDQGKPVLLGDQNRALWDVLLIRRGDDYLNRAFTSGSAVGSYCLQAGIAGCHAHAESLESTRWDDILALYDGLAQIQPTPVVKLNRALAMLHAEGPEAALAELESLDSLPALHDFAPFYAAKGDVLQRLERCHEAESAFLQAASLTTNEAEAGLLQRRALTCRDALSPLSKH